MRVAIVGAGPAGLAAAGAVEGGAQITVLERNEKPGKKLYITGKGRCNVTHDCTADEFLEGVVSNPRFLFSALHAFSPADTVALLNRYGVPTKTERGDRVFPLSDKASDVTKALVRYATDNGARFRYGADVRTVTAQEKGGFALRLADDTLTCDRLILACGGMSYPGTGSNGDGYRLAAALGHTIVEPRPALVPVELCDTVAPLQGLALKNVRVTLSDGKTNYERFGELLFTDRGVTGPVILSLSSLINRAQADAFCLTLDVKPALSDEQLDRRLLSDFAKYANKQLKNALDDLLPRLLIPYVIERSGIAGETFVHHITKAQRAALLNCLKRLTFSVRRLGDLSVGIVTAGGVRVREVSPKTMESKRVKGLFFAGELLDVDAYTGGYNIQIALSTGYAAGKGVSQP